MHDLVRTIRKTWMRTRRAATYLGVLSNGVDVIINHGAPEKLPVIRFRNGTVWNRIKHDDRLLLLREIYFDRFYDRLDVPAGGIVLDIGANIGAVTLFWAKERPDLKFHLYEPNPETYAALCANVRDSGVESQIVTHCEAVGGTAGHLELWVDVPSTLSTAYGNAPAPGARKISVPVVTLDTIWERVGRLPIGMLKIDVEGAECDILEKASDTLLANVQTACIEWHSNLVPKAYERCCKRLDEAGFTYRARAFPWDEGILYAERARPIPAT